MICYRFAQSQFSHDISGEGAKKIGGRWNSKGIPVVYCSLTISLSLLELFIHSLSYDEIKQHHLMIIESAVDNITEITTKELKKGWQLDIDYCKFIGDEFLRTNTHLFLKVPSSIIPDENNLLINPAHKDFSKVRIKSSRLFEFDSRLFKTA